MSNCEQCIVRQFNSLKSLTKEELIRISGCKTSKTIKKGQLIFDEGENVNGVYCIREGICKLTKLSANGRDQIVKLVVKGDLMGQRSLVSEEVTNLSATALSEMEVCFIPKHEIMADLHKNSNFTFDVLQHMAKDLREADNVIVNMAQKSVRQRLAEALIYIHRTFGTTDEGMLRVILSREDYANIVGTATESVIRILSQFKKDNLITTKGKQIRIEDLEALKHVS
ncbi:cyclic nucleotide-binding domain-containing protein [Kordia sp. TARA_039_SRF]|nr:cyclic nucleotide-binding domain-containing protein [Kordia sp. TARA_039_SRF]